MDVFDIKNISSNSSNASQEFKDLPVVPVRDIVIFPGTVASLFIGRKKSVAAIQQVLSGDRNIVFASQFDPDKDDINSGDLPNVASLGNVLQCIVLPDETVKVLVDCVARLKVHNYNFGDVTTCNASIIQDEIIDKPRSQVFIRSIIDAYEEYVGLNKKISSETIKHIAPLDNPVMICDIVASYMLLTHAKKLEIFTTLDVQTRINKILEALASENDILRAEKELQDQVKSHMEKNHREHYLNEQMKIIRKELGDHDDNSSAAEKYEGIMKAKAGLNKEAREKIQEEIKKLRNTPGLSSESGIIKSYLDLILGLPWNEFSNANISMTNAIQELEMTHYGMEKVKERILEYIAVQMNTNEKNSGTVLCLYGPPGVGKTTLARSMANAMGKKFARISLGGMRDSSELFGHRRTYVGALPGRIINAMKSVGESNPLILLDEIDKTSADYRGDPAAALLEILDPEQNVSFHDHYLEVGYDISKVIFVATANSLDFSSPLKDRMELIHVPSYLENDKIKIASQYIIPKQSELCGIKNGDLDIRADALHAIIQKYTREAGVRELERCIAKIARKSVMEHITNVSQNILHDEKSNSEKSKKNAKKKLPQYNVKSKVLSRDVDKYLGVPKFLHSETEHTDMIGVVNGLAYTDAGGDVLVIEAVKVPGKGELKFTGRLGEVMKESMQAAYSYIKANCSKLNIKYSDIIENDVHVHAPEGAVPKDGPSAGVTISTAIISLFTGDKINHKVAMTGEITLRGRVLPIGGLREKLVAAVRSGITDVCIPHDNIKDLEDVPKQVKDKLNIHPCQFLTDVTKVAFALKLNKRNQLKDSQNKEELDDIIKSGVIEPVEDLNGSLF